MGQVDLTKSALRLLKDSEIVEAIRAGLITIDNPDVYLKHRRDDLIQPASMDLVLRAPETHYRILGFELRAGLVENPFDRIFEGFVTFWPGFHTQVSVNFLRGYNGGILRATPELRSTLRRVGLDKGLVGVGIGDDEFGFLDVRNPQDYPVSIEVGEKIAQVIWTDLGTKNADNEYGIEERKVKFGSGRLVTSRRELLGLIGDEEIYLSDMNSVREDGRIRFHAGNVRAYCRQGPVTISKKGVKGFEVTAENAVNHEILPGQFSDIETIERIGLSGRIAMGVHYHAQPIDEVVDRADLFNRMNTYQSSGGWIDPGYGYGKKNGAPFSVQRKAFTKPIVIREGDLVGFGEVYCFPEPVEKEYSEKRGSHYNEAMGFVGPRK